MVVSIDRVAVHQTRGVSRWIESPQSGCSARNLRSFFPGIAQKRAESDVVAITFNFDLGHADGPGHPFKGGHGVGTHDLRGDEEVNAIDEVFRQHCGIETGTGFSEKVEDAFGAEFVEDFAERDSPAFGCQNFDANTAIPQFAGASFIFGDSENYDIVLHASNHLAVERHAEG
jgi:hypothetical protein